MQIEVVGAKFYKGVQEYYFSPNGLELKKGDKVIVDTEKGKDIVEIVSQIHTVDADKLNEPLKNVITSCAAL